MKWRHWFVCIAVQVTAHIVTLWRHPEWRGLGDPRPGLLGFAAYYHTYWGFKLFAGPKAPKAPKPPKLPRMTVLLFLIVVAGCRNEKKECRARGGTVHEWCDPPETTCSPEVDTEGNVTVTCNTDQDCHWSCDNLPAEDPRNR